MYTFSQDLQTGNLTIDSQHKQWIDTLNNLLQACSQGKGRDNIRSTLIFLQSYTAKHFADEEALQNKYHYPQYITHKQYHEAFKKVVQEIIAEYDKTGPTILLTGKINSKLGDWFINHIKNEDKKMAAFIQSQK